MARTVSQREQIKEARREIRGLRRPPGVRRDVWQKVKRLLDCLAGYGPDPYPSRRTLASKLGWSRPTVDATIRRASELGLLATTTRALEGSPRSGTTYLWPKFFGQTFGPKTEPVLRTGPDGPSDFVLSPGGGFAAAKEAPVPNRFNPDDDFASDPIGADPEAPLPVHRTRPVDPGQRLAAIFDECWGRMAAKHREWAKVRPSERGMAVAYIKNPMLQQVTEDVAEEYIRAFAPAVADGRVDIKLGQWPFMAFTKWWGTEELAPQSTLPPEVVEAVRAQRARIAAEYEAEFGAP